MTNKNWRGERMRETAEAANLKVGEIAKKHIGKTTKNTPAGKVIHRGIHSN